MKFTYLKKLSIVLGLFSIMVMQGCQFIAEKYFLPSEGIRQTEYSVVVVNHVPIKMRDNTILYADVYHPRTNENTPTIMVRIPYSKTLSNSIKSEAIARFWAKRGYHVVIQGTRGRYESEGKFYPLVNERNDGVDTLSWLNQQPWFDGRLGMWGGSAFGYTQWVLSDQINPGPKALSIQIASTSFYDMFYPGGGFALESGLFWSIRSYKADGSVASQEELNKAYEKFPLIMSDDRAIADIKYFNDWATHSTNDDYWLSIDGGNRIQDLQMPVFMSAGWFDPFLPSQLKDFQEIRNSKNMVVAQKSRLVIGPWAHAETVRLPNSEEHESYRSAVLAPSIDWFDEQLQFKQQSIKPYAPVQLFVMGDNVWRNEYEWPLERTNYTNYYLSSGGNAATSNDGKLKLQLPNELEKPDIYKYDPKNPVPTAGGAMLGLNAGVKLQNKIELRQDVLVYSTTPLTQDLEITGPIKVVLFVKTTAQNTDFTVKLVNVHIDGKAYNVSDGLLRKKYDNTGANIDSPVRIEIDLWPTSIVFKKGHSIRLEVSSSNYPRYDRNPNTGNNISTETNTVVAEQTVFHDHNYPSHVILPIIP